MINLKRFKNQIMKCHNLTLLLHIKIFPIHGNKHDPLTNKDKTILVMDVVEKEDVEEDVVVVVVMVEDETHQDNYFILGLTVVQNM
jgi:hypothetical protein